MGSVLSLPESVSAHVVGFLPLAERLRMTRCSRDACRVLHSMTVLDVGTATITEDAKLCQITKHLCWKITDAAVNGFTKHCPNLLKVDLSSCCNITNAAVCALAERCTGLTSINLSQCTITNAAVCALAERCTGLTSISLFMCRKITDAAVLALAHHCPRLQEVNLSYCTITDAAVCALAKQCTDLTSISLTSCAITDVAVLALAKLAKRCSKLKKVDLRHGFITFDGCEVRPNITDAAVCALAKQCTGITSIQASA